MPSGNGTILITPRKQILCKTRLHPSFCRVCLRFVGVMVRMLLVYITNGRFPYQTNNLKEKLADIKWVIEGHKTHWLKKNLKRANNDLRNTTHKTKDWATGSTLQTSNKLRCSGRVSSSYSSSGTCHDTLTTHLVLSCSPVMIHLQHI